MAAKIATPRNPRKAPVRKGLSVPKTAARKAAPSRNALTVKRSAAKATTTSPAAKPEKNKRDKKQKKDGGKAKVVRDSFTMPKNDYDLIAELKQRCQKQDMHVKKSELLRAGLQALSKLSPAQLKHA
ncbi:MAG TPA: hypothetical protein VFR06_02010, partial [Gallionellaceae bacterium]|nr:hypothetical protein [Gallionellaceae bacterium]